MTGNIGEGIAAIFQHAAMRIGLPALHAYVVDEVFCVVAVGGVDDEVVVGDDGGGVVVTRQRNCLERWLFFSKELGDFDYAAVGIDGA